MINYPILFTVRADAGRMIKKAFLFDICIFQTIDKLPIVLLNI